MDNQWYFPLSIRTSSIELNLPFSFIPGDPLFPAGPAGPAGP